MVDTEKLLEDCTNFIRKTDLNEEYRSETLKHQNSVLYGGTEQALFIFKRMREEILKLKEENLVKSHWLIPTAEVPLTNIVAEMIVEIFDNIRELYKNDLRFLRQF